MLQLVGIMFPNSINFFLCQIIKYVLVKHNMFKRVQLILDSVENIILA